MPRTRPLILLLLLTAPSCGGGTMRPSEDDTSTPVAIDVGAAAGAPSTYKGLPLALVDRDAPEVTAVDGIVGVVCIGMSNGNQECTDWQSRVAGEYAAAVRPEVRIVNCAVGGHAVERWIDPAYDDVLWQRCIDERLPALGVRTDQVRVIWHKAANQFTTLAGGGAKPLYPEAGSDYEAFRANLPLFAARLRTWFPAVQAVYTSSRSYGGFANSAARGEPLSYEEGHALNTWLAANASVDGASYGWGPYLWAPACASGETNGSGICYDRADYVDDGVHPSASGRAKVSQMLHARFLGESWYGLP